MSLLRGFLSQAPSLPFPSTCPQAVEPAAAPAPAPIATAEAAATVAPEPVATPTKQRATRKTKMVRFKTRLRCGLVVPYRA